MPTIKNKITHILFSALPAWGHIRPFCILAARLVKEDSNMVMTVILSPAVLDKAQKEALAELRGEMTEDISKRLRILSSFKTDAHGMTSVMARHAEAYVASYQALSSGKPIACAVSGTIFDAVPPPNIVVLDYFSHPEMLATRAITGTSVPIAAWLTGHAAPMIRIFGPANHGGHGNLAEVVEEEAKRLGTTAQEIGDKVYYSRNNGTVVKIPGLPDMYDWEYFPQKSMIPMSIAEIVRLAQAGLKECDVVLVTTTYTFEKQSIDGMKAWLSDWNKDVFAIGPLLPSGYGIADTPRGSTEIQEFLDKKQAEDGPKSVVLIAFGSVFWPSAPEYIEEVIEALIENKLSFILSTASPVARLSDALVEKIKNSGFGITSGWCPQQYILNHPATGWFLTHCGHNSVMEAIGSGVPMICWPFDADQPAAAAHLSENLGLAFELIEVRTGENGLKPLYRNGRVAKGTREAVGAEIREVLQACRGTKGEEMRKNVQKMKTEFAAAWGEEGISRKEWNDFLNKYSN